VHHEHHENDNHVHSTVMQSYRLLQACPVVHSCSVGTRPKLDRVKVLVPSKVSCLTYTNQNCDVRVGLRRPTRWTPGVHIMASRTHKPRHT
jgi:hypothetical protein